MGLFNVHETIKSVYTKLEVDLSPFTTERTFTDFVDSYKKKKY